MFEELQLALMDIITPERLDVILDAHQLLTQLGTDQMDTELQNIIGLQDGIADTEILIGRIEDCLFYAVTGALAEYGVALIDEATLSHRVAVLTTVGSFEYYIVPQTLHDIAHGDLEPEEVVADMCPLFTALSSNEALEVIASVSWSTIKRIRQVAEDMLPDEVSTRTLPPDYALRISRINFMLTQTRGQYPALTKQLAERGILCGSALELLIGVLLEELHALDIDGFAHELLGLLYYSKTPLDDFGAVGVELITDFTDDLGEQRRMARRFQAVYDSYCAPRESSYFPSIEHYG